MSLCFCPGGNGSVCGHFKDNPLLSAQRNSHSHIKGIEEVEAGPGCLDRRFLHGPYQGGSPSPIVMAEAPGAIQFFRAERSAKRIGTGKLIWVGHVNTNTSFTAHGAPESSLTVAEGQGWPLFVPQKKAWSPKRTLVKG